MGKTYAKRRLFFVAWLIILIIFKQIQTTDIHGPAEKARYRISTTVIFFSCSHGKLSETLLLLSSGLSSQWTKAVLEGEQTVADVVVTQRQLFLIDLLKLSSVAVSEWLNVEFWIEVLITDIVRNSIGRLLAWPNLMDLPSHCLTWTRHHPHYILYRYACASKSSKEGKQTIILWIGNTVA